MKKKNVSITIVILVLTSIIVAMAIYSYLPRTELTDNTVIAVDNESEEYLYSKLPEKPDNFIAIRRDMLKGDIKDLCRITEEYYLQPDFYSNWETGKAIHYDNHDYSRWGVHGYGAYPANAGYILENMKEGEYLEVCTFFKTGYGVETYQGAKLVANVRGGEDIFKVEIITQEFEEYPDHFLFEPAFPVFSTGWVKNIKLKITALRDVPVGEYEVALNVEYPDDSFNEEMIWKILMQESPENEEYIKECINNMHEDERCITLFEERRNKYVSAGGWQISSDFYALNIKVTE